MIRQVSGREVEHTSMRGDARASTVGTVCICAVRVTEYVYKNKIKKNPGQEAVGLIGRISL